MQLSSKQIDLMKHCIGLHRRKPYRRHGKLFYKPYRNYFDCGRHDDSDWSELANYGYAVDYYGKGWYELTKAGFEALSSAIGIHICDDIAALAPVLPKRLYVIGPGIIDSAGDEAVFEEAAESMMPTLGCADCKAYKAMSSGAEKRLGPKLQTGRRENQARS